MKVAFFIDTAKLNRGWTLDIHHQALSGTDSLMIQVAQHICEEKGAGVIYATSAPVDPDHNSQELVQVVSSLTEAAQEAAQAGISKLVFIVSADAEQSALLEAPEIRNLQLVGWLHNTPPFGYLSLAAKSSQLQYLICVSNTQAFSLSYHPIFRKVIVLPNFVDTDFWQKDGLINAEKTVTYVGALKESKGFHLLANAWPIVHRQFPEWKLDVCGSPGLYGGHEALGKYRIAEKNFEERILRPLGGTLSASQELGVRFLGSLVKETLREHLEQSRLVVVNPNSTGSIETFCVSAVEAQAMGIPVVGGAAGGLLETVGHGKGGLLSKSSADLARNIIRLIENEKERQKLGRTGRQHAVDCFGKQSVLNSWEEFLLDNDVSRIRASGDEFKPKYHAVRALLPIILPLSFIALLKKVKRLHLALPLKARG